MCSDGSSEKAFSFLEGVNPDTVSRIQIEEDVFDMVYSQSSGLIYATSSYSVSGFKWDGRNKTFNKQFETSIKDMIALSPYSITLAPRDTSGGDQIYISVGFRNQMKTVYRLGGRELKKIVLLPETLYIDDECPCWVIASNTDRHILLIHPQSTRFIYIHVKEQTHGKVDLNLLHIPKGTWLPRIELIGQLLILGVFDKSEVCLCELIVTEGDASIKSGYETVRIKSYGHFVALSQVVGQQDQQVHLFTAIYKSRDCTDILEYKFNLFVDDSDLNQLSTQPINALRVKGEFYPYCLVNVNYFSSVLIGKDYPMSRGKLTAVELLKEQVKHHVQQSTQEHSEQHTRTAVNSECVIS